MNAKIFNINQSPALRAGQPVNSAQMSPQSTYLDQLITILKCLKRSLISPNTPEPKLNEIEQLALLVRARELFSSAEKQPIAELQSELNFIALIKSVCGRVLAFQATTDQQLQSHLTLAREVNRYMALEVAWILTNMAMGPCDIIEALFFDRNDDSTQIATPSVVYNLVVLSLTGSDLALQEIILWFLANCMEESVEIARFILRNAKLLDAIKRICTFTPARDFSHQMETTLLWVVSILARNNLLATEDLHKIQPALRHALSSSSLTNKTEASRLLMEII